MAILKLGESGNPVTEIAGSVESVPLSTIAGTQNTAAWTHLEYSGVNYTMKPE